MRSIDVFRLISRHFLYRLDTLLYNRSYFLTIELL